MQLDDDAKRLTALKHAYGDAEARHRSEQRSYSRKAAATAKQLAVVAAALPRIRGSADAPCAITINDHRDTDRAEAAPALLHAARQAYADGKNSGQQRSFSIAELRGVEVRASRWLSSDELALALSIPWNTTTIAAKDLGGEAGLGLVRRVEIWCATDCARGGASLGGDVRTVSYTMRGVRCPAWPSSSGSGSGTAALLRGGVVPRFRVTVLGTLRFAEASSLVVQPPSSAAR